MAGRLLSKKPSSSLDAQRLEFEKSQTMHFSKAINALEGPAKIKHVRALIIGTHTERGARVFWALAERAPLHDNPLTCWKFCHVLHKLAREGHTRALADSVRQCQLIQRHASFWAHLPETYGKLIQRYCAVLLCKLRFHAKHDGFPGSLAVSDDALETLGRNDANNLFEMAVDLLDYIDEIVHMQTAVFASMDSSRCSSMTKAGQCLLAPLIPCIQDSIELYNHSIKILFKLHSSLPDDLLSGHRQRFIRLFTPLRTFYARAANLQYFKALIQIPQLPESPPNFFSACQATDHVPSAVILPEADDEVDLVAIETTSSLSSDLSVADRTGGDTSSLPAVPPPPPPPPAVGEPQLREELQLLHQQLSDTRHELGAARHQLSVERQQLATVRRQLSVSQQAEEQLRGSLVERQSNEQTAAAAATAADEKFAKMKLVYQQLRDEHIQLIRNKATSDQRAAQLQLQAHEAREQLAASESSGDRQQREDALSQRAEQLQRELEACQCSVSRVGSELAVCRTELDTARMDRDNLAAARHQLTAEHERLCCQMTQQLATANERAKKDLDSAASDILARTLEDLDNPTFATVSCSPDYALSLAQPLLDMLASGEGEAGRRRHLMTSHLTSQFALYCAAVSHTSPDLQLADEVTSSCRKLVDSLLQWLPCDVTSDVDDVTPVCDAVRQLTCLVRRVGESQQAVSGEHIADLLQQEMTSMDQAIEAAAQRIQAILEEARAAADGGVRPQVHGHILDSCTRLMTAVRRLVGCSHHLQQEIVAQGRAGGSGTGGGASAAEEFYRRNHRWTEGLISAAKAVAVGAHTLLASADKMVGGDGKFEEVIVATHEIAACSAQLVIASKVKADRNSANLSSLSVASREVSDATAAVVATVRSSSKLVHDASVELDVAGMSLHESRRREMDSRVNVLRLESELQAERARLATLRRQHYQLATAAGDDWEHVQPPH